jgi:hypothetical protein
VHLVLAILAAVTLAAPFGGAEAAAVAEADGAVTVEISVAVSESYSVVLVRPFSSFEELAPTALTDRGDGTWGGFLVVPTAEDWSIVFDGIAPDGSASRSETTSLTALGVDPVVVEAPPVAPLPSRSIDATTIWLLVGVVLALAALGALAWWTFGGSTSTGASVDDE